MKTRKGFTLVELVVVVMILGILAAVAAPRLLGTSGTATDNGVRQTLSVVRDAIERYAAEHSGEFPGEDLGTEAGFKADLKPYLRGAFPTCPVGDNPDIEVDVTAVATDPLPADTGVAKGWRYSTETGQFIINSDDPDNGTPSKLYSTY